MTERSITFEALVSPEQMPVCPLCGKHMRADDRLMVFIAHGRTALAHDSCHPKLDEGEE